MEYFLLKQSKTVFIPKTVFAENQEAVIYKVKDIAEFKQLDYIKTFHLISDRVKILLELYLPTRDWRGLVFINDKSEQAVFWYLDLNVYENWKTEINREGQTSIIDHLGEIFPRICKIKLNDGSKEILVHLSIAESIIRRGYLGVEFIKL